MNLVPGDNREPFEKFVDRRAFIEMFKQGRHGQTRPLETPGSSKLARAPVDGGTERPVHALSLHRYDCADVQRVLRASVS